MIRTAIAALVALMLVAAPTAREPLRTARADAAPQTVDRSKPPTVATTAGGFRIRRINELPKVDGRAWIEAAIKRGPAPITSPNKQFTLIFDRLNEEGDTSRHRVQYHETGRTPATLNDAVGFAYITPDSRWIVLEPIDVVDVGAWLLYPLSRLLDVTSYVFNCALSADWQRLAFAQRPCPFDCRDVPTVFYELEFPRR